MNTECTACGARFEATGSRGRTPLYCSAACKKRVQRARKRAEVNQIPDALRSTARWVRCDARKRPVTPAGVPMAWTHPDSWMTFSNASKARYGAGRGFVLGEGIGVIDLDNCIADDGSLSPAAVELLERNSGAWVERSQSGRGLHIWGRISGDVYVKESGLEVYAGDRKRFMWVTGDTFRAGGLPVLSW